MNDADLNNNALSESQEQLEYLEKSNQYGAIPPKDEQPAISARQTLMWFFLSLLPILLIIGLVYGYQHIWSTPETAPTLVSDETEEEIWWVSPDLDRDLTTRSEVEQIYAAIERHRAFQGYYPWQQDEDDVLAAVPFSKILSNNSSLPVRGIPDCTVYDRLSEQNAGAENCEATRELRASFIERISRSSYPNVYLYYSGEPQDELYLCFVPQSEQLTEEATTRCQNGLPADLQTHFSEICSGAEVGGSVVSGRAIIEETGVALCVP